MIDHLIRSDFRAVDKRDEIGSVYGYMMGKQEGVPIVCDNGKPFGVVNERGMMRSRLRRSQHLEDYVIGTRTLPPDASVESALDVISHSRIPHVPVTEGDRIVGYVRAVELLDEVDADLPAERLGVEVPILRESDGAGHAMHQFKKVASHVLPVLDENGNLSGVVQRRDMIALATDARPDGRKPANGENEVPRDWPVEGYVLGRYEALPLDAPFPRVRDALKSLGFVILVDGDGKPRAVVTPESAASAIAGR